MEITAELVMQLISSGLFPIVVCFVMFKVFDNSLKDVKQALNNNTETIKDMRTMMQTIIDYTIKSNEEKEGDK